MADTEDLYALLPQLRSSDHLITSPETDAYNCVAWVERDTNRFWDPEFYWPAGVPRPKDIEKDLPCYLALFESLGFERCLSGGLEPGFLKIAIYATGSEFHHVAKQLPSGGWSSKGGYLHDFRHSDVGAVEGAPFLKWAKAEIFMKRPFDGSDSMMLEETGLIRLDTTP